MAERYCISCRWWDGSALRHANLARCLNSALLVTSRVTGETHTPDCEKERTAAGRCGEAGLAWEAPDAPP
jgi:hypothetical protein